MFEEKYAHMMDKFDYEDEANIGRPRYFSIDLHLWAIDQLINAEEITFAFKMMDRLPSFYRIPENEPPALTAMRKRLYKQLWTHRDYIDKAGYKLIKGEQEFDLAFPRGHAVLEVVKKYNEQNVKPFIFDIGCGNFFLPRGLKERGCRFTYKGVDLSTLGEDEQRKEFEWQENATSPTLFVAFEIFEHLTNQEDIRHYAEQLEAEPDWVFLSTPLHNFGGTLPNWEQRDLGHLASYNPKEFTIRAQELFPNYNFKIAMHRVMVLIGEKRK